MREYELRMLIREAIDDMVEGKDEKETAKKQLAALEKKAKTWKGKLKHMDWADDPEAALGALYKKAGKDPKKEAYDPIHEADTVVKGFTAVPEPVAVVVKSAAQKVIDGEISRLKAEKEVEAACDKADCDHNVEASAKDALYNAIKLGSDELSEADDALDEELDISKYVDDLLQRRAKAKGSITPAGYRKKDRAGKKGDPKDDDRDLEECGDVVEGRQYVDPHKGQKKLTNWSCALDVIDNMGSDGRRKLDDLFRGASDSPYDYTWEMEHDKLVGTKGRGTRRKRIVWDGNEWRMSST